MSQGFNTVIRWNDQEITVDQMEAIKAEDSANPIAAILGLLGMKNISVMDFPKEVQGREHSRSSIGKSDSRRTKDEWDAISKAFLEAYDRLGKQSEAARIADPAYAGKNLQTIRAWAKKYNKDHLLWRKAEAPKTPPKKK